MENRRTVYNNGDSVVEDLPTPEEFEKMKIAVMENRGIEVEQPIFEKKVFMTDVCLYCGNKGLELKAICRFCGTCQSCGLLSKDRDLCRFCGNEQDIIIKKVKRTIRA